MKTLANLVVFTLLSAAPVAQAKEVLKCYSKPSSDNGFVGTTLEVHTTDAGGYSYVASKCAAYRGRYCLEEIGDYVSYGEVERNGGNFKNDDVEIIGLCGAIRAFYDRSKNVSFYFVVNECQENLSTSADE